jgi:polyferredoxin
MREQVCQYMCPYARFQSVMFDADTLVISYDAARGERGGRVKRAATRSNSSWGLASTAVFACRCAGRH